MNIFCICLRYTCLQITYRFADDCSLCKNFTMDNKGRILAGYPNRLARVPQPISLSY